MTMIRAFIAIVLIALAFGPGAIKSDAQGGNTLYRINLDTGPASAIGTVGGGQTIRGLTLNSRGAVGYALTTNNSLVVFNLNNPASRNDISISGLANGETIIGIDMRPSGQRIVALTDFGNLYNIQTNRGLAIYLSTLDVALESSTVGIDFNPTVDRLRIVTNTGQNLRVNVDTGVAIVDGRLAYAAGEVNAGVAPQLVGSAYTNSVPNAQSTELYGIDIATGNLVTQAPPNDGVLNTDGPLGIGFGNLSGFDITPGNVAYVIVS